MRASLDFVCESSLGSDFPSPSPSITLTESPPYSIPPSLLVDRRKAFKDSVSIFRPVTMTMALAWKTNERPDAPVLTAKMSFSPIASPANVDGAPHYRCGVTLRATGNGGSTPPCALMMAWNRSGLSSHGVRPRSRRLLFRDQEHSNDTTWFKTKY